VLVADLHLDEAAADVMVVAECLERHDEQPVIGLITDEPVDAKVAGNLFDKVTVPLQVVSAPAPVILGLTERITHQQHLMLIAILICHCEHA
jgi:hypothetical protein